MFIFKEDIKKPLRALSPHFCAQSTATIMIPRLGTWRREKLQCLSVSEISGFRSLHLRNYFTVMDNNESKVSERFEHKCFWVGPRTVWLMSLLTINKTLTRFSLRLWQAGQWPEVWGKQSKGSWNSEYSQRSCRASHRAFNLSSLLTARFRHNMWVSCVSRIGHAGRNRLGNYQWRYFPGGFWWS